METSFYQEEHQYQNRSILVDNVSGMCKDEFTGNDIQRVVFP